MADNNEIDEQMAAPPASPSAEDAGRHGGEAGQTDSGAPGASGGTGIRMPLGMSDISGDKKPPEGDNAIEGCDIKLTGNQVKLSPEQCKRMKQEKEE